MNLITSITDQKTTQEKTDALLNQRHGYKTTTSQYIPVQTQGILKVFQDKGFNIDSISKARTNNPDKEGFQRHLITMSHPTLKLKNVHDAKPQILLLNSFDGSQSLRLMLGVYRLVCANGLICGENFEEYRVIHRGDSVFTKLSTGIKAITEQLGNLETSLDHLQNTTLTSNELNHVEMIVARQLTKHIKNVEFIESSLLTRIRREADTSSSAWVVLNRVQENAMKGGLRYTTKNPKTGELRSRKLCAVKSIDRQVAINRFVWNTIEKVAS